MDDPEEKYLADLLLVAGGLSEPSTNPQQKNKHRKSNKKYRYRADPYNSSNHTTSDPNTTNNHKQHLPLHIEKNYQLHDEKAIWRISKPTRLIIVENPHIMTKCHIISMKNCTSFTADVELDQIKIEEYRKFSCGNYNYTVLDPITLIESQPKTSVYYNCRMANLQISYEGESTKSGRQHINKCSIDFSCFTFLTSGNFNCELYGVDSMGRLVINLINTVNDVSISGHFKDIYSGYIIPYNEHM